MIIRKNQSGVALLAVIFFLVVMAFVGVIFISLSSTNMSQSVNEVYSSQALYIAEGGLERAGRYLLRREDGAQTTYTCDTGANSVNTIFSAPTALGSGQFTVTSVFNNTMAPTTLSAVTLAADLTVSVISTTGYAPFGRIMIDKEMINYTSTSATAFLGVIRGADGTTATSHTSGTPVAQTQCLLTSTGGVPTISSGTNQRVVSMVDSLQFGMLAGNPGGVVSQQPLTIKWDGSIWATNNNTVISISSNLNSVTCLNSSNCWAVGDPGGVGQRPFIIGWNGTTWTLSNTGPVINQIARGITCVSQNNCWAVGDTGLTAQPFILNWTGAAWVIANTTTNSGGVSITVNKDLNSVYCVDATYCFAVGDPGGGSTKPLILLRNTAVSTAWIDRNDGINNKLTLLSIHCVNSGYCWAVGQPPNGGGLIPPGMIFWNGSIWAYNSSGLNINKNLNSVYCVAVGDCWAVGDFGTGPSENPLILHLSGTTWARQNTGLGGLLSVILRSVTCISTSDCWATGDGGTLVHWDGANWTIDPQSGVVTTRQLNSLSIIGPKRPNIAWQEVIQ